MKNYIKVILVFVGILSFQIQNNKILAQDYERAVGIRGGDRTSLSYKRMLENDKGMIALLSFKSNGVQFTAIHDHYMPNPFDMGERFHFSMGYGGHVGFFYKKKYRSMFHEFIYNDDRFSPIIGLDAYFNLEYHLHLVPICVGVDYKPYFEFSVPRFVGIHLGDFALNLKYTF